VDKLASLQRKFNVNSCYKYVGSELMKTVFAWSFTSCWLFCSPYTWQDALPRNTVHVRKLGKQSGW